jgi:hypothetical protein
MRQYTRDFQASRKFMMQEEILYNIAAELVIHVKLIGIIKGNF